MKKGRSTYTIKINDKNIVNQNIQNYLNANGFVLVNQNNESFYRAGDVMVTGYRCFKYSYTSDNEVTIWAWVPNLYGSEFILEQKGIGSISTSSYKSSLDELFNTLTLKPEYNNVKNNENTNVQENATINIYEDRVTKKNENLCLAGFIISLVFCLLSFIGFIQGWIIYFIDIYFAILGLKTKKKGLAIATFVFTGISFIMAIIWIMLSFAQ